MFASDSQGVSRSDEGESEAEKTNDSQGVSLSDEGESEAGMT